MSDQQKIVTCCLLVSALCVWLAVSALEELNTTRVIMIRADYDLPPSDVSAVVEEAKRITGESSL
jgi:hypothetical protein